MPWLKSSANWFPKTEEVQPDEIRVTFMGSSPLPRPGQMGTSVYVELGNELIAVDAEPMPVIIRIGT